MEETHSLTILFRPGMEPVDRFDIEDALGEALGEVGEITGGGTMVDLSESDISVEVDDREEGLRIIREVLQGLKVAKSTVIVEYEPERIEHPVYE